MRQPSWVLLLAPLCLARCGCDAEKVTTARPVALVEPLEIDFGVVCVGDTVVGEITIANDGLGDLQIEAISIAQSAQGYSVGAGPQIVAPGGLLKVPVTLTVTDVGADYNAQVLIRTNDEEHPQHYVNLAASAFAGKRREVQVRCPTVANPAVEGPCIILDFGQDGVRNGTSAVRTAKIRNNGCAPMTVYEVKVEADTAGGGSSSDEAMFSVLQPQPQPLTIGGQKEVEMRVQFSPRLTTEFLAPNVRYHVRTDDPDKPDYDGGIRAYGVAPVLFVDPPVLTFFGTDTYTEKQVKVTNAGGANAAVTVSLKPGSSPEWVIEHDVAEFASLAPGDHYIGVRLDVPPGWQGSASGTLLVDPSDDVPFEVKLVGGAVPEALVTPNPVGCWSADGGGTCATDVPVGAGRSCCAGEPARTAEVLVTNVGYADLRIDAISDVDDNIGDSFSVTAPGLPITLARGGIYRFVVTFRDNPMITDDAAALAIYTNDPQHQTEPLRASLITRNPPNFPPTPQVSVTPNSPASWTVGAELTFDGTGTSDQENDAITYQWTLAQKPAGSTAALVDPGDQRMRKLTPDVAGNYTVTLIAADRYDPRPAAPSRPFSLTVTVR